MSKNILFIAIVLIIAFLNVYGLPSNITNRFFSKNLIVRYALTDKEIDARNHISQEDIYKYGTVLGSDSYYIAYIQSDMNWYYPQRTKVRSIDDYLIKGSFVDCPYNIILIRHSVYKEPFAFGSGSIYKLEYNPIELAQKQGYNILWQNEEIVCLVKK